MADADCGPDGSCSLNQEDSDLDGLSDTKLARRAAAFRPDAVGFSLTTGMAVDSVAAIYAECRRSAGDATKSAPWSMLASRTAAV